MRASDDTEALVSLHLRLGWWSLLVFLSLGTGLEALHALKVGFYLSTDMESRRLMWTLAHSHGALFGLVNIAFAATVGSKPEWDGSSRTVASRCLAVALVLMPGGFFLGGAFVHAGDPGLGVWLVPGGALALMIGVLTTTRGLRSRAR